MEKKTFRPISPSSSNATIPLLSVIHRESFVARNSTNGTPRLVARSITLILK